jgi:hypothetical protein
MGSIKDVRGMKWLLVLVFLHEGRPYVNTLGMYSSMYDCFDAFEELENQVPQEAQLVCIKDKQ